MAQAAQAPPGQLLHYQPVLNQQTGQPVRLGSGAYGTVYRYKNASTGEEVAVKRIALTGLSQSKKALLRNCLEREILNHHMLNHPHVLKLKDVFVTEHHLNLVLELAEQGMLFQYVNNSLAQHNGRMPEADARWFFQQLVLTMDYFHRKGVAHRDIKLENTLLKSMPGWTRPIIRVADFGLSKHDATYTYTKVGTADYMSPEVLKAQRPGVAGPGQGYNAVQADIWSAGVMLYAMLVGRYPFDANMPEHVRLQLMARRPLELPSHLSQGVRSLLEALLHPDPSRRYTIQQITQDPWFLQELPAGALNMSQQYLNAPSPCVKSQQEVMAVVGQALQIMDA